ncbi:MAG: TrkH family potassium uptake protein [Oscillospiraceae bacterium]|nr:TrkH family potassium uptake protein [Oscillospiraceae bacterium]
MANFKKFVSESSNYGKLILLVGLLVAAPLAVVPFYPEDGKYISAFLLPSAVSVVLGLVLCFCAPRKEKPATQWQSPLQKGSLPVMFAWCFAFFAGAAPFMLGGQLNFMLALFESVSGWTTTGLTVADVALMPHIFLFHRAFMQYCGGLGFIIMIAMLVQNRQNMNLYSAEGHPDRIMPSLKRTSQIIFLLYSCFLAAGSLAYRLFGMKLFDALCHSMCALSTAGFTTQAESIGGYHSLAIEITTVALMLVGSTNFSVLLLLVKGKFRKILRVSEVRFMIGLICVFVPLAAFSLMHKMGMGIREGLINSLFGVVTTFTTTGYSTMDYSLWPPFALGLLMALMIIGGSVGSTAGGIKLLRAYLLIRITKENVKTRISPARKVTELTYFRAQGQMPVDNAIVKDTFGFVACYMGVFIVGTLLLTLTADCPLFDAMFEFASAFGTVGISNGLTNAGASAGSLVVLMSGMILGRLEVFIVFIGIYAAISLARQKIAKEYANMKASG